MYQKVLLIVLLLISISSCLGNDDDVSPLSEEIMEENTEEENPTPEEGTVTDNQQPCVGGMAGAYPCNGYDLFAHLSLEELNAVSGNDIWGWVDTITNEEYALIGLNNGTAFARIEENGVRYIGRLPTATSSSSWRDIKVKDNHAYIVAEASNHGMQVFNLSQLRGVTNPREFTATTVFTGIGSAHNVVVNEETNFAYPVGTKPADGQAGGVHFIDIQNPSNPVEIGGYAAKGYTHDAQVINYNGPDPDHQGAEIFIGANENEVVIIDITNKDNPTEITSIDYPNIGYTHQGWFTNDQRYFLLGDETDEIDFGVNSRTIVFDFTDLDNPVLHTTYLGPTAAIDHNGYVLGSLFFLANYTAGVRMIDISALENRTMQEVGYFDTYPNHNNTSFDGVWSVHPYLPSGKILVNDINNGFFVIQPSE